MSKSDSILRRHLQVTYAELNRLEQTVIIDRHTGIQLYSIMYGWNRQYFLYICFTTRFQ
jgi:hypothetical protein